MILSRLLFIVVLVMGSAALNGASQQKSQEAIEHVSAPIEKRSSCGAMLLALSDLGNFFGLTSKASVLSGPFTVKVQYDVNCKGKYFVPNAAVKLSRKPKVVQVQVMPGDRVADFIERYRAVALIPKHVISIKLVRPDYYGSGALGYDKYLACCDDGGALAGSKSCYFLPREGAVLYAI